MLQIFRHTLIRSRGQIIGWGIALFLLGLGIVSFYDTVAEQKDQFEELLKSYPPEMMAFFGDLTSITTPQGFLSAEYFVLMPIILGIFVLLAGSGLLASDEEKGTMDLILAHPVSRTGFFFGRLLALGATTLIILAIGWVGIIVPMSWSIMDIGLGATALPFLSLFGVIMLFGTLAILLSMLLPSRRLAAMITGLVLVASFFITGLARFNENLETIAKLSPLNYYQSGDAILGLNVTWFVGLLAAAAVFAALSWWRFEARDIRVGGEGGWRLSLPWRKPAQAVSG